MAEKHRADGVLQGGGVTFGFHLIGVGGSLGRMINDLGWPVKEAVDILHTATDACNKGFMSHSTVVPTCTISAGAIGTTDFKLTPEQKQCLLQSGRDGAKASSTPTCPRAT